ncbi:hypothetical protein G7046_g6501 [Stylonectria norvegica]|nr:hypothetical protein G7046_g6501 [Stylonectria norvegica]
MGVTRLSQPQRSLIGPLGSILGFPVPPLPNERRCWHTISVSAYRPAGLRSLHTRDSLGLRLVARRCQIGFNSGDFTLPPKPAARAAQRPYDGIEFALTSVVDKISTDRDLYPGLQWRTQATYRAFRAVQLFASLHYLRQAAASRRHQPPALLLQLRKAQAQRPKTTTCVSVVLLTALGLHFFSPVNPTPAKLHICTSQTVLRPRSNNSDTLSPLRLILGLKLDARPPRLCQTTPSDAILQPRPIGERDADAASSCNPASPTRPSASHRIASHIASPPTLAAEAAVAALRRFVVDRHRARPTVRSCPPPVLLRLDT